MSGGKLFVTSTEINNLMFELQYKCTSDSRFFVLRRRTSSFNKAIIYSLEISVLLTVPIQISEIEKKRSVDISYQRTGNSHYNNDFLPYIITLSIISDMYSKQSMTILDDMISTTDKDI